MFFNEQCSASDIKRLFDIIVMIGPFSADSPTTHSGVFGILAGVTVYSLMWSLLPFWNGEGYGLEIHATSCSLLWRAPGAQPYMLTIFVTVLVVPAVTMVTSYILITRHIRQVQPTGGSMAKRMFKVSEYPIVMSKASIHYKQTDVLPQNLMKSQSHEIRV